MARIRQISILGIAAVLYALLAVPNFAISMFYTPESALAHMRAQGNSYSRLPLKDAELTPDGFMNSFWQQCQQKEKADKNSALNDVLEARSLLTHAEFRCHIAAGLKVGADVPSVELCNAVIEDDIALTTFFLFNGADPQKKPRRGADRPIYWARSPEMAQLLLSFGAQLPISLDHCIKDFYDPELIPFFASRGADVRKKECECVGASTDGENLICNVSPFQRLILHADKYCDSPLAALKKAALLKQCGADMENVEYVVLSTGHHPGIIRPIAEFIKWRIQQFESSTDEQSIKTRAVLEKLLAFVQGQKPKTYNQMCIEEFANKTPLPTLLRYWDWGLR